MLDLYTIYRILVCCFFFCVSTLVREKCHFLLVYCVFEWVTINMVKGIQQPTRQEQLGLGGGRTRQLPVGRQPFLTTTMIMGTMTAVMTNALHFPESLLVMSASSSSVLRRTCALWVRWHGPPRHSLRRHSAAFSHFVTNKSETSSTCADLRSKCSRPGEAHSVSVVVLSSSLVA